MGHRSSRLGDDRGIPSIRLGFARVQVRDAAHGEPGQIRHCDPFGACDSDRQRPDRRRLINDEQQRPMGSEFPEQRLKLRFAVGQRSVQEPFAPRSSAAVLAPPMNTSMVSG